MKRKLLFSLLVLFFHLHEYAQSPNWDWAIKGSGTGHETGTGSVTDSQGNSYITGSYSSSVFQIGGLTLNGVSTKDFYIAKINASGTVVWAKRAGLDADGYQQAEAIAIDSAGNLFVSGTFGNPDENIVPAIAFDNDTLTGEMGEGNFFLVKYDSSGTVVWAKNPGKVHPYNTSALGVDKNGFIYMAGLVNKDSTGNSQSEATLFLDKYTSTGTPVSTKAFYEPQNGSITGIVFNNEEMYLAGFFLGPEIIFQNDTLLNAFPETYQSFLVKYDQYDSVAWAKSVKGVNDEFLYDVKVDANGDIIVTGSYDGEVVLDSLTLQTIVSGETDLFVAKYNAAGSLLWAKNSAGTGTRYAKSLVTDENNDVYVLGGLYKTLIFGSDTLKITNTNSRNKDVFVLKYSASGSPVWSKIIHGDAYDNGVSISRDANGNMLVFGEYSSSSVSIGSTVLTNATSPGSLYEIFLAKLNKCVATKPSICMVTTDSLSQNNIIIWNKTMYPSADSFFVYRETATNKYQLIASVPSSAESLVIDTVRTKYFPNTGDPQAGTYRYKIKTRDICGNYSEFSSYHNTIFITENNGTFSWPQLYTIENNANPVDAYVLMRDDFNNGSWHAVNSVSGTQQSMTDPAYNTWKNTANWRVETQWNITCVPTTIAYRKSRSNTVRQIVTSVPDLGIENISVYPNPATDQFVISSDLKQIERVDIYNVYGVSMVGSATLTRGSKLIQVSGLADGLYFLNIQTAQGNITRKLIVKK
jgi:hypothetical protein